MRERSGGIDGRSQAARRLLAGWAVVLGVAALPQSAHAQFFFWDRPHFSADDAARSVIDRGFRPLARPVQNGDVYTADVIDRRGRRERLIVSAENGQILQRFVMEDDRSGFRRYADPTIPRGPVPPGRIPNEDSQPNVFSRLFSGDRNDTATGSTTLEPGAPVDTQPKARRRPRLVERTPEPARPASRIDSAPLAPPTAPAASAPSAAPAPGAAPAPSALAPTPAPAPAPSRQADVPPDRPVRNVVTNPLSIPGTREQDEKTTRATPATASAAPVPARPAAPKPPAVAPSPDVPVAPLD